MMAEEELGLETFVERKNEKLIVTLPDTQGKQHRLTLSLELTANQALVCRRTVVFKFPSASDKRPREADLGTVQERDVR